LEKNYLSNYGIVLINKSPIVHISTVRTLSDVRLFYLECCSLSKAGFPISLVIHDDSGNLDIEGVSIKSIGKPHPLTLNLRLSFRLRAICRAARCAMAMPAKIYHLHDPELIPEKALYASPVAAKQIGVILWA